MRRLSCALGLDTDVGSVLYLTSPIDGGLPC